MSDWTRELLTACPECGCGDLFTRKGFPQKLGLSIVIIAAITFLVLASSRQHFFLGVMVLIFAAIIDAALYLFIPKLTCCYRCRAEFRHVPVDPNHVGFDLATAEKYRKDSSQ